MTRGHPLSDDLRRVLIYMGTRCSFSQVKARTGVPRSTLRDLYAEYKKNGHIFRTHSAYETRGRKRKLTMANVGVRTLFNEVIHGPWVLTSMKFLTGNIRQRNDLYLDELQDRLSSRLGVEVSSTTIWKTLHDRGFTMKKVCLTLLNSLVVNAKGPS